MVRYILRLSVVWPEANLGHTQTWSVDAAALVYVGPPSATGFLSRLRCVLTHPLLCDICAPTFLPNTRVDFSYIVLCMCCSTKVAVSYGGFTLVDSPPRAVCALDPTSVTLTSTSPSLNGSSFRTLCVCLLSLSLSLLGLQGSRAAQFPCAGPAGFLSVRLHSASCERARQQRPIRGVPELRHPGPDAAFTASSTQG